MITSEWKRQLFLLILFLLPVMLFSGGQKEDVTVSAQELMDQRKWDEAILIIKDMMVKEPSRFDEGQLLIQKIMWNKRIYNEYFQKLVDAYLAGDLELAYQIIGEMEAQDPQPNPRTKELIVEARATAGVIATKTRFDNIMEQARIAIDEGRLYEAVDIYLSGSDIARDLFGDLNLGNIVENQVDTQNAAVIAYAQELKSLQDNIAQLQQRSNEITVSVNPEADELTQISANIRGINNDLQQVLDLYRKIVHSSIEFLIYHDQLQEANNLQKDIYHLKYIAYLYSGRPSATVFEGVSGIIDILTSQIIDPMEDVMFDRVKTILSRGLSAFDADRFDESDTNFSSLDNVLGLYFLTLEGWSSRSIVNAQEGAIWRDQIRDYSKVTEHIALAQALKDILVLYNAASDIGGDFISVTDAEGGINSTVEYTESRAQIQGLMARMEALFPDESIPRLAPLLDETEVAGVVQGFIDDKNTLLSRMTDTDIRLENSRIRLVIDTYTERAGNGRNVINDSSEKIAGYQETDEEGGLFFRDPNGGKSALTDQRNKNSQMVDEISAIIAKMTDNPDYVRNDDSVQSNIEELRAVSQRIENQDTDITEQIALADEYIFQAQRYKQEGDDYFQEARTLLERNEFERAKQRVEDVASRYDQALTFQDDPEIRNRRDNEIPALYDEIIAQQKQFIVREVRTLINEGRSNYSQGDFLNAESVLLRAQSRYSEVSVEPEPEIEYWLTLSQTALSINSGREILPVDPLYPEMTQLLNLAKADYNSAKEAIQRGNRSKGITLLDQAEVRIQTVQQPFPQNQEASLLYLKLLQLRDPDEFDATFTQRFNNARDKLRSNPQEGYIELKDLQALRPDFRGMDDAIYQAEIATGIRVPPPDTTKIRRAEELYSQAYNIVQGNITAQFPIALSALNEAIRLNPDYIDAIRLKDRIQTAGTGIAGATAILSARDQQQYEEAVNAYQNGLYREAQLIVDRLLRIKDNQRNTKLLELKERVQSKL